MSSSREYRPIPGACSSRERDGILISTLSIDGAILEDSPVTLPTRASACLTIPHSKTSNGEPYVRHNTVTVMLAAPGECVVRTCTQVSLLRPEGISNDAQAKLSALSSLRTPWRCRNLHLGPLLRITTGIPHIVIIPDKFQKLTQVILTGRIISTTITTIFLNNCVMPYGIPSYELTYNKPQSMSKFYTNPCLFLGVKKLKTTFCHPRTNGQFERYNCTVIARKCHYYHNIRESEIHTYSPLGTSTIPRCIEGQEHQCSIQSCQKSCHPLRH